ncbi:MAG: polyphosphate kinase 2 [Rhizobiales bacterium]|nr:polyphosphate kinase 2 [Hyphomicrobiales bacterium]
MPQDKSTQAEPAMLDEAAYTLDADELPEAIAARCFPHGAYAYDEKLGKKKYEKRLEKLQIELVKLQAWVRASGERIVMVFEGRDAAGKGGTIKRFTQYMNPRHARVVALSKPSDVETGQWYFQRYVAHLPTNGEIVMFDRSWYNRGGVERVMGFCSEDDVERFFLEAPVFEGLLERDGVHLFKFWLTVSREEQLKRFYDRKTNPLKGWKLSPMDHAAVGKWNDYTKAIADIFRNTDTPHAPWTVVDSNDQKRARLEAIKVVLKAFDYDGKDDGNIGPVDDRLVTTGLDFLDQDRF